MELFVVTITSTIKGVSENDLLGVFSTSSKADECIQNIAKRIIESYSKEFMLEITSYNAGEDNDCPCIHIEESDDILPEFIMDIESNKRTLDKETVNMCF